MKLIALFSLVCFTALSQVTPINKGRLQSNLDGNQKSITNLAGVVAGTFTVDGGGLTNIAGGVAAGFGIKTVTNGTLVTVSTTNALGTNILIASQIGARGDAKIHYEIDPDFPPVTGSDDTAILQAALDAVTNRGSISLILDGFSLVGGLYWHSNTTIFALPGCGLALSNWADRPLIRNANPSKGAVTNFNFRLAGGHYYGNQPFEHFQPTNAAVGDGYVNMIGFYGVTNITVTDVDIDSSAAYGIIFSNWKNVYCENIFEHDGQADGIHFLSGTNAVVRRSYGGAGADFIALNSSDYHAGETTNWIVPDGDIRDVLIQGIKFIDTVEGISMLAMNHVVENVIIEDVIGDSQAHGVRFWNFWSNSFGNGGYIANVTINNLNVTAKYPITFRPITGENTIRVRNVQINNSTWQDANTALNGPAFISSPTTATNFSVDQMSINGFSISETNVAQQLSLIDNYGRITNLAIANVNWTRPSGAKSDWIVRNENGGLISQLAMTSLMLATNMADTITNAGVISQTNSLEAFGALTVDQFISIPTNYSPANFIPIAGRVKIASSNGALFSVTQLSTNALSGP